MISYHSADKTQQDRWVVEILNSKREGYFIDIGASDGVHASNTYALEKYLGWEGICIEPNSVWFKQCRRNRSCACENLCVYNRSGTVKFTEPLQNRGYGGITKHLKDFKKSMWEDGGECVIKPCVPLVDLLDTHSAPAIIDYLSIDTEGSEQLILEGFPFDRYQFRTLTIEGYSCDDILARAGYQQVESSFSQVDWERFYINPGLVSL